MYNIMYTDFITPIANNYCMDLVRVLHGKLWQFTKKYGDEVRAVLISSASQWPWIATLRQYCFAIYVYTLKRCDDSFFKSSFLQQDIFFNLLLLLFIKSFWFRKQFIGGKNTYLHVLLLEIKKKIFKLQVVIANKKVI